VRDHNEVFVAFDTSKLRNAVAIAEAGRSGEVRFLGEIDNTPAATAKLLKKLAGQYDRVSFCYEAGPTGYGLYRQITGLGQACMVVAPSLIPKTALLAEIGDLSRFHTPRELMAYLGLVPSEHSTGDKVQRGGITKAGNRRARRLLVECSWAYRHPPRIGNKKQDKVAAAPQAVREIAWKAQHRLYARYRALIRKGKLKTVAVTAVARELCGFIWAVNRTIAGAGATAAGIR